MLDERVVDEVEFLEGSPSARTRGKANLELHDHTLHGHQC